jgi:hypothetical protein
VYNILFSIVMSIQLSLLLILPYFFLSRLYITYTIDSVILHIILIEVSLRNSYHRIYNASNFVLSYLYKCLLPFQSKHTQIVSYLFLFLASWEELVLQGHQQNSTANSTLLSF